MSLTSFSLFSLAAFGFKVFCFFETVFFTILEILEVLVGVKVSNDKHVDKPGQGRDDEEGASQIESVS